MREYRQQYSPSTRVKNFNKLNYNEVYTSKKSVNRYCALKRDPHFIKANAPGAN